MEVKGLCHKPFLLDCGLQPSWERESAGLWRVQDCGECRIMWRVQNCGEGRIIWRVQDCGECRIMWRVQDYVESAELWRVQDYVESAGLCCKHFAVSRKAVRFTKPSEERQ